MVQEPRNRRSMPVEDTLTLLARLEECGFTHSQATALVRVTAQIRDDLYKPEPAQVPPAVPPLRSAAPVPATRSEVAAVAAEIRTTLASYRKWLNGTLLAWIVANLVMTVIAIVLVCLVLAPEAAPRPATLAPFFLATAGVVIGVAGWLVAQFI